MNTNYIKKQRTQGAIIETNSRLRHFIYIYFIYLGFIQYNWNDSAFWLHYSDIHHDLFCVPQEKESHTDMKCYNGK